MVSGLRSRHGTACHQRRHRQGVWRLKADWIDPAKVSSIPGKVFFYADHAFASCLDLKTGKALWKTDAPILKNPAAAGTFFLAVETQRIEALASPDVYLINSFKDGRYQAFSAKDGKILWGQGRGRDEADRKWTD